MDGAINKIACVTMKFPAPSETFQSNNVRVLAECCEDVSVYSLLPKHKNTQHMIEERRLTQIKLDWCECSNYLRGMLSMLTNPKLCMALLKFIVGNARGVHLLKSLVLLPRVFFIWSRVHKAPPDVLHLLWGHYPVLVGYIVKRTNPEVLLSMGLVAYDLTMNYGCSKAIAPYVDILWTQAKCNVPHIQALGFEGDKIKVIVDGLDLDVSIAESRKKKHSFSIVSIARLVKPKGVHLCVEAFSLIADQYPDSRLVILGDGPERSNLENLVKEKNLSDKILFKGHVDMHQVAEELAAAEVFLFMSFKIGERLPNVVKEAMANKALCIVSRTPGIDELVTHGETGFILEENTPEEAAELLQKCFAFREKREVMTDAASGFIVQHFDCRKEMRKLLEAWRLIHLLWISVLFIEESGVFWSMFMF